MATDDFYKNGFYILVALIVFAVFILVGKGIAAYSIANGFLVGVYISGAILLFISLVFSAFHGYGCLISIIVSAFLTYIVCLTSCERNYKVTETNEGISCKFETWPYSPVTLLSGTNIDTINVNGWLNRNKSGGKIYPEVKTLLLTNRHDGRVTLSSLCNNWMGINVYVECADSIHIDRRQYFDWYYDVFKVWQGDSTYTVDIRGHNPDLPGYCPLVFIDDTPGEWPN